MRSGDYASETDHIENVVTDRAIGNTDVGLNSIDYTHDIRLETGGPETSVGEQRECVRAFDDPTNELFKRRLKASCGIY